MATDQRHNRRVVLFFDVQACGVISDVERSAFLRFVLVLGIALDGDELPATAQASVLRTDSHSGDAPPIKPPVFLFPDALRGENPAE